MSRMTRTAWGLDTSDDLHQWRLYAACRGYDPSWWDLVGKKFTDSNRKAVEICRSCPVRSECADMAAETGSWGVILAGVAHYGGDRARTTVDSSRQREETGAGRLAHRASPAPVLSFSDPGKAGAARRNAAPVRGGGA